MRLSRAFYFLFLIFSLNQCLAKQSKISNAVEEITDAKEFKKLLRTKNNVLICFINSVKEAASILKVFKEAAEIIRGQGTMVLVDCSGETKKTCKKLKVTPQPFVIRHYKDGEFHKDYDRKHTVTSMVSFMRDPTGDIPWEEEASLGDVVHIPDYQSLQKILKKETKPIMVMFYAPWCGFCKQLKPEYTAAASLLKNKAIMAAIDVNRPENAVVRSKYNITGFPTLLYFQNGELKQMYEGDNKKDDLVRFMNDPTAPPPSKPKEEDWSLAKNDVLHLNSDNFDTLKDMPSVLVMFYAPWCGHCKKLKPEYEKAATALKKRHITGVFAALDATKEPAIAKKFGVKGYPTLKYFKNGEFLWDLPSHRDSDKLMHFMINPEAPPPPPPPQPNWEDEPSEVLFLNVDNFKATLKKKKHALVMFYAPWCGHCKNAKPEFTGAAEILKDISKITFAAVDCTKEGSLCKAANVEGYPTFKYYHYYDKLKKDYSGGRHKDDFINFMLTIDTNFDNPEEYNVVTQLTDTNYKKVISQQKLLLVLFDDPENQDLLNEFKSAATSPNFKRGTFAVVDVTQKKPIKEYKISKFPTILFFKNGKPVDEYTNGKTDLDIIEYLKKKIIAKDEL